MLGSLYAIAYESVCSLPQLEYEYYADKNTSRERNYNFNYIPEILTLESPLAFNKRLLSSIEQIKNLKDDWDGYGAVKPSIVTLSRVESFLSSSPNGFIESLNADSIYPNPNGTISIEWENDIEGVACMEIGDSNATFYAKFNTKEIYINNNVDIKDGGINHEVLESISKITLSI